MAKFIKENELNYELEKLFNEAEEQIILISPYIKLHDRYSASLLRKIDNPEIKITLLFGKNEDDISKSMKQDDFEFFKQFPNIEILHEKRLHAKYYANERKSILTSMNLYGYSQNNNIEAGVLFERKLSLFGGDNELDDKTWDYFVSVLNQAELLFLKEPVYEKKNILSATKYVKSEILEDKLSDFFNNKQYKKVYKKTIKKESKPKETRQENKKGYCIRTGVEIPFNIEKPLSYEAFKMWNKYGDTEYPEKYCHFSGEKSNGDTCVSRPILRKNWKKAQDIHGF